MLNIFNSEKKLAVREAMISSVGDGLVATDRDGTILLMNPAAEKMLLQNAKEVIGKNYVETVPAADKEGKIIPGEKRPLLAVLKHGKSFTNHKNGSKFPAAITTSPINYQNSIIGAIITFRDVTHEKEVDRMKTEFISLASHQLRTPLSAISWLVELLQNGDAGQLNRQQLDLLGDIYQSNKRMIQLVSDLLNISRMETGRIIIDPKPTHLGQLLEEVLKELKPKINSKRQKLIISYHPDLSEINIDPNLIRAVYLNLISNAIKFTPEDGEITVIISKKGEEIISQITDSGLGIPKKEQGKIFQKFYRGSNVVKKVFEGTGLGLYLVKSIILASKGKIWFKSQENKGTTFWFSLPISGILPKKGDVTITS
ncbi:MAG: Multi-sensor signal transduction histidine kinase [Candidatus Curtissbacteria bacterium GW2011_GWA1_40_24]|uniref:histidine kinase n=1 Tax=Candidatus Curtissbacteria bacterium GW2011_GWA1_40_24 TaxID=1618406 RepID=A0A0G0U4H0_9BACT|nr:MAG: Multi-sensor signal transduction histidine kinase [Candidatus Curtissbacteria bacterium GW2011_GWA1_40_24]